VPQNVEYGVEVHFRSGRVLKTHPLGSTAPDDMEPEAIVGFISETIVGEIASVTQDGKMLELLFCAGENGVVLVNPAEIEYVNVIVLKIYRITNTGPAQVDDVDDSDDFDPARDPHVVFPADGVNPPQLDGLPVAA
jgi:hypothetical protein